MALHTHIFIEKRGNQCFPLYILEELLFSLLTGLVVEIVVVYYYYSSILLL